MRPAGPHLLRTKMNRTPQTNFGCTPIRWGRLSGNINPCAPNASGPRAAPILGGNPAITTVSCAIAANGRQCAGTFTETQRTGRTTNIFRPTNRNGRLHSPEKTLSSCPLTDSLCRLRTILTRTTARGHLLRDAGIHSEENPSQTKNAPRHRATGRSCPGWIRTISLPVQSRTLCRLSYWARSEWTPAFRPCRIYRNDSARRPVPRHRPTQTV